MDTTTTTIPLGVRTSLLAALLEHLHDSDASSGEVLAIDLEWIEAGGHEILARDVLEDVSF